MTDPTGDSKGAQEEPLHGGLDAAIAACAQRFAESRDLYVILKDAVSVIRDHIGLDRAGIFLFDAEKEEWHGVSGTDEDGKPRDERWIALPKDPQHPLLRAQRGEGDEFFVENFEAEFPADEFMRGVKNCYCIALRAHHHLLGGISVDNALSGWPIDNVTREKLRRFARYIALAIENLQLLGQLEGQNKLLREELERRERAEEEREAILKELQRAYEDLKDFAHVVSHDLRSPLQKINSMVDWITEDHREELPEEVAPKLASIQRHVNQMGELIRGVLDYSKAGKGEMNRRLVETDKVIEAVVDLVDPPLGMKVEVDSSFPMVFYDETQLRQVFLNLIGNAVKYMGKAHGHIYVTWSDADDMVEFCVRDTGRGIEEKDFERIFKMLKSLRQVGDSESTGIGLAVVKKIVERNGGEVRVESKVGKGSSFFFTIPKEAQEDPASTWAGKSQNDSSETRHGTE